MHQCLHALFTTEAHVHQLHHNQLNTLHTLNAKNHTMELFGKVYI